MKLHAQDVRRSAGAFAAAAAAAGLALTGCGTASGSGPAAATATSGTGSATSSAASATATTSATPASAVVSSGSLPFPTTVGDTWNYSNSNGTTSENKITSATPVAAGDEVAMAISFKDNGTTSHTSWDYIVEPNGQIALPTSQFTSSMSSAGASVKLISGGIYWPTSAQVSSGQPIHSTLIMEITVAGKTQKITEHITSTGEGTQSVTVPAGTYSTTVVNVAETADFEGYNLTIDDKTWLAAGVGPVQSELISVDGGKTDITNKQVLTSFVKG
ncbi:MAG: hypothetical protein ABSA02_36000 [Trebonia sp.]|jgi:hypothetical protein